MQKMKILFLGALLGCDVAKEPSDSATDLNDTFVGLPEDSGTTDSEDCANGTDDDLDGQIDCADSDCADHEQCVFPPPPIDYTTYERVPEQGFTPVPDSIPLPSSECTADNTIVWSGTNVDCTVPEDSCAIIETGSTVLCQEDATVYGTLWMKSDSSSAQTLLVADNVFTYGSFFLSGESTQQAQHAEIFLRHSYCGLPENDYALTAATDPDCNNNGNFHSMGGVVKIAGAQKTAWSLLSRDSADSHQQLSNSIQVDGCRGWNAGDQVVITATGGDETSWTGMINDGFLSNTDAETKWKAEQRTISSLDPSSCEIVLDSPLLINHRGNPTTEPLPRIQAEVLNQTRSVRITGGYLTDPLDPSTRVATAYDYVNNSGTPTASYSNAESVPCKQCQDTVDGAPVAVPDRCDVADSCQHYDSEDVSEYSCGEGCGLLGAQGITTAQMHGGVMQLSYTSVEHCGRRDLAEYCLHLHHVGDVQYRVWSGQNQHESYFVGNSVQHGVNKGITVHGTHRALVQHNVIYNNRGPSIYIEDGNELENVIEENVAVCSEINATGNLGAMHRNSLCRLKNASNRPETSDSDYDESSGIYFLSSYNHVIGNRVSGYDNAMYVNAQGGAAIHGLGDARLQTCVSAYPFGYTVGNVFHNNAGFGWYANTTFPQDLIALGGLHLDYSNGDQDIGTVTDWTTCQPFSSTGADQSFNVHLYNHLEYFNDFSAGGYDLGDISLHNYTNYGSNKSLYWKTYRRGEHSGPLCEDCTFVNTNFDLMGGSALVEFQDSHFYSDGNQININHHCRVGDAATGSLCASHYDFRSSLFHDYDGAAGEYVSSNIYFSSEVEDTAALIFAPDDKVFVRRDSVAFDIDNDARCQLADAMYTAQSGWWQCTDTAADTTGAALGLRIVRIYSADRGTLLVTNHSEGDLSYTVDWQSNGTQESPAARVYPYAPYCTPGFFADCPNYMYAAGYVFVIPNQAEISLQFSQEIGVDQPLYDLLALEYSEEQMTPPTDITIRALSGTDLMDSTTSCSISSTHSREFLTPFGPMYGAAGAWYTDCQSWELKYSIEDYFSAADDYTDVEPEPSSEPSTEPEEPDDVRLYLTATELLDTAPSSTSTGEIPANPGNNVNTLPTDPSLITTLSISGISGAHQSGDIALQLSLDAQAIAQTAQARVRVDLNGDGTTDVERMYNFWALDAAFGSWEQFTTPAIASESGSWSDMTNGSVTIDLWSSFGGEIVQYQIGDSYIALPIEAPE